MNANGCLHQPQRCLRPVQHEGGRELRGGQARWGGVGRERLVGHGERKYKLEAPAVWPELLQCLI